jgi:predicted regulator of amino acid metabolism with ACT domain
VGAAFGHHGVNIHSAAVGAAEGADEAVMAITTDAPVPHEVIDELTGGDDFYQGRAVSL